LQFYPTKIEAAQNLNFLATKKVKILAIRWKINPNYPQKGGI
jgi:hypothetical protein